MVVVSAPLKHLQYQKQAVSLVPCSAVKSADSPRAAAASTSSAAKSAESPRTASPDEKRRAVDLKEAANPPKSSSEKLAAAVKNEMSNSSATPRADALFNAIGKHLDEAGEAERKLLSDLAEFLWTGSYTTGVHNLALKTSRASRVRLEVLLSKAKEVREKYQNVLFMNKQIKDLDFLRDLTHRETSLLHNAWRDDVGEWMSDECRAKYDALIAEADAIDEAKRSAKAKGGKGKGKCKGNAVKLAEKGPMSEDKSNKSGPRQKAHQICHTRFNKVISDMACKKTFFMCFVRYPSKLNTCEGVRALDGAEKSHGFKRVRRHAVYFAAEIR